MSADRGPVSWNRKRGGITAFTRWYLQSPLVADKSVVLRGHQRSARRRDMARWTANRAHADGVGGALWVGGAGAASETAQNVTNFILGGDVPDADDLIQGYGMPGFDAAVDLFTPIGSCDNL